MAGNNWLVKRSLAMKASTTSIEWLEASSSPLLPLGAARTVYPKVSRNTFSHSSTAWLSQRTIPFESFGLADGGMVHLQEPIFNTLAQKTVQNYSHHALLRHCSRKQSRCSTGKESKKRTLANPCNENVMWQQRHFIQGKFGRWSPCLSLTVFARQPACGPFSRYGLGTSPRACTLRV